MSNFVAEFDDKQVKEFVDGLEKNLKSIKDGNKKYMNVISPVVFTDVMQHFKDEAGSDGPWKKWSASYKDHMDKIGKGGNKILQDTGTLRQSFLPTNWKSSSKGIYWFNKALTRSGFAYAYAHDTGDGVAKRDFMWLSDKGLEDISNNTLGFMTENGIKS